MGGAERASSQANHRIGWASLVLGVGTGLLVSLWSFGGPVPVPAAILEEARRMKDRALVFSNRITLDVDAEPVPDQAGG